MKKNNSFGIMQGRLTPANGRGIQFFPFDNWRQEFDDAAEIGLDEIEFIFDYENYVMNPLWMNEGSAVGEAINASGVKVNSVCFDYFMRKPFFKYGQSKIERARLENVRIIMHLLENMKKQGIGLIEIPLVDDSSIQNDIEMELFKDFLTEIIFKAPEGIRFGLETDFSPNAFKSFLEEFDERIVGANYDVGNSSGIGYKPEEELCAYGSRIFNIHVKDRIFRGTTVQLGTGSADFDSFFSTLARLDYKGNFIMQAARSKDGSEKENIKNQLLFVKDYLEKYKI